MLTNPPEDSKSKKEKSLSTKKPIEPCMEDKPTFTHLIIPKGISVP